MRITIALILFIVSGFSEEKNPTVVVVGGGLAGLTTAYRLQQKGFDVQVYEARNRVGGRILSAKIGDHVVELGGQNIADGGEAKTMYRLIDELNLELTQSRICPQFFYFNGVEFIPSPPLKIDPAQLTNFSKSSKNMREVLDQLFQREDPLYQSLSVRLAAYEGAPIEKLSSLYTRTLYYMMLGGLCSVHQEEVIDFIGIKGGNALLPEKLAQSLKVHLDMQLTSISKTANGTYSLSFLNGTNVQADILVLAIPCSVYMDILFDPNVIPEKRLTQIRQIQYGTNAKILLPLSHDFGKRTLINGRVIGFSDANIFTLYYTGDAGYFSSETISDTYHQDEPMLADFKEKHSPMFAYDEQFVSYGGAVGYSWPNDPYVKGSYSYIAPGQEKLLTSLNKEGEEWVKMLFAPIDRSLYFAGEHATILLEVPGTMEGACESGERTARMISEAASGTS